MHPSLRGRRLGRPALRSRTRMRIKASSEHGTAFIDQGQGHVHSAFNRGSQNLVLVATYFDVPVGASPRIDAATAPAGC